jgi:hypothetical protein
MASDDAWKRCLVNSLRSRARVNQMRSCSLRSPSAVEGTAILCCHQWAEPGGDESVWNLHSYLDNALRQRGLHLRCAHDVSLAPDLNASSNRSPLKREHFISGRTATEHWIEANQISQTSSQE